MKPLNSKDVLNTLVFGTLIILATLAFYGFKSITSQSFRVDFLARPGEAYVLLFIIYFILMKAFTYTLIGKPRANGTWNLIETLPKPIFFFHGTKGIGLLVFFIVLLVSFSVLHWSVGSRLAQEFGDDYQALVASNTSLNEKKEQLKSTLTGNKAQDTQKLSSLTTDISSQNRQITLFTNSLEKAKEVYEIHIQNETWVCSFSLLPPYFYPIYSLLFMLLCFSYVVSYYRPFVLFRKQSQEQEKKPVTPFYYLNKLWLVAIAGYLLVSPYIGADELWWLYGLLIVLGLSAFLLFANFSSKLTFKRWTW